MCPQSAGLVKSDPMNTTKGRVPHNYSSFDESLSYKKYNLVRYADYIPSFEMEGVEKDEIRLNTKDIIDSLSLNAPFKGTIRKIKESFKVPMMALLPLNWDLFYTQPSVGDDVPPYCGPSITNFPSRYAQFWSDLFTQVLQNIPTASSSTLDCSRWLTALMRCLVAGEFVYSKGSLLNCLGYKGSAQFEHLSTAFSKGTYDQFFDSVVSAVFQHVRYFAVSTNYNVASSVVFRGLVPAYLGVDNERYFGDFRGFLDAFRENPTLVIVLDGTSTIPSLDTSFITALSALVSNKILDNSMIRFIVPNSSVVVPTGDDLTELSPNTLNLSRPLSYQMIYFHFFTNSSLDPVYSAELFRNYVQQLEFKILGSNSYFSFSWNGSNRLYDYLSGWSLSLCTFLSITNGQLSTPYVDLYSAPSATNHIPDRLALLSTIFCWRHSLRYGDYFVGSRPRPLAPINTDVAVNNNAVSVIDITRMQWNQRFGNAVMRSRQKVENYVEMLFGKKPDIDYHNPLYLSREVDVIYGDEVQNTGASQVSNSNSRTSNLRGGLGQFTFTFHNDDMHSCIYMQIISFDIKRAYTRSVDRQFLHIDRYDMFNPNFQFIGDQPIYGIEIGYPEIPSGTPQMANIFGYTSRDMEYKQRFDVVSGGFEDNLPGWILTDVDRSKNHVGHLAADFIRNENCELDRFFLSLTGYSLGTYFHFVCITQNNVAAKRSMSVDPQILG